jgi:multidrug efflux pump subunit AcrB
MSARANVRVLVYGLALLGTAGCPSAPVGPKAAPEIVDQLELRIDAPGMSPESIEREVVAPIELSLVGNSDVREIISEASEGRARIGLALSRRAELVAVDVLQRVTEIQPQLPEEANPLELRPGYPNATTMHLSLANAEAARTLSEALASTPGVHQVSRCGVEHVVIELDSGVLHDPNLEVLTVEAELRAALQQSSMTLDQLNKLVLDDWPGNALTLAEIATIRVEPATSGCKAWSEQGQTVGLSVTVAHADARTQVEARLNEARERGLDIHRFDSRLHVWLGPEFEPERAVETIRELLGSEWLLEVGVEAQPCAGPGVLARLHLSDQAGVDAIAEALAATAGVVFVEHPTRPSSREWLLGSELEQSPERVVVLDREKLAAHGVSRSAATLTIALALQGLEIGRLAEPRLPVLMRLGNLTDRELSELLIAGAGDQTVPLGAIAELRTELAPTRICRRNGERGVVVLN